MRTSTDLRELLSRIDRRSYPAYKDTRGAYQFPGYVLSIDHVQGDPFASPSQLHVQVDGRTAGFPPALYRLPCQRAAPSASPFRTPSPDRLATWPPGPRARRKAPGTAG